MPQPREYKLSPYFRKEKLYAISISRGYRNFYNSIALMLGCSHDAAMKKMNERRLTLGEVQRIARGYRMTFSEFYEVFLYGLYDRDGVLIPDDTWVQLDDKLK